MKQVYTIGLVIFYCLLSNYSTWAQTTGDYRSATSGNWTAIGSWERYDGTNWVAATAAPSETDGQIAILSGHTITVNLNLTADQVVVNTGATLTLQLSLYIKDGVGEDLTVYGTLLWNAGAIGDASGPGTTFIATGATVTMATTGLKGFGGHFTNNGNMDWQEGNVFFNNIISTLTNNGTFLISGNNSTQNNSGGCQLVNNGIITKTGTGNSNLVFTSGIINGATGAIHLNAGTITTSYPVTNTGNFTFNGGAFVNGNTFNHNGGTISGTGSFTNNGTLHLAVDLSISPALVFATNNTSTTDGDGDLTIPYDFTIHSHFKGAGTLTIQGNTTWNSGTIGRAFTNASGNNFILTTANNKIVSGPIINAGAMDWQEGDLLFYDNTSITNNSVLIISGNSEMKNGTSFGTFINNGTVSKTSTGTTTFFLTNITNNAGDTIKGLGTISFGGSAFVNNGVLSPGLSPGMLTVNSLQPLSANSTLVIEMLDGTGPGTGQDQLQRNSNLTLNGILTVTETGIVPNGTYTIIQLTAGTISGNFTTVNLPAGYTLVVNTDNVRVVKNLVTTPVKLLSFTGNAQEAMIALHWVTTREVDNDFFEVERSGDGIGFAAIGRVKGSTATTEEKEYDYIDGQSLYGNNFYRLKQVDKNGVYAYSTVIKVVATAKERSFILFPNPVRDVLRLQLPVINSSLSILILDAGGQQVFKVRSGNRSYWELPVRGWANGIYQVRVIGEGIHWTGRFIKK